MSGEFFGRLETELREAAERPPRRAVDWRPAAVALAAAAVVAVALVPVLVVLGGGESSDGGGGRPAVEEAPAEDRPAPVGTVIEKGTGTPFPREVDHTVVATGVAPVAGPWQMETYESTRLADPDTGEEYQPAGLPCLGLALLDPPADHSGGLAGQCGEFPRTPGFGRMQQTVPNIAEGAREILVYGTVPERAATVRITADGGVQIQVEPLRGPAGVPGDFYLIPVPPDLENGRVNWIDGDGSEGSRGIGLLPP